MWYIWYSSSRWNRISHKRYSDRYSAVYRFRSLSQHTARRLTLNACETVFSQKFHQLSRTPLVNNTSPRQEIIAVQLIAMHIQPQLPITMLLLSIPVPAVPAVLCVLSCFTSCAKTRCVKELPTHFINKKNRSTTFWQSTRVTHWFVISLATEYRCYFLTTTCECDTLTTQYHTGIVIFGELCMKMWIYSVFSVMIRAANR